MGFRRGNALPASMSSYYAVRRRDAPRSPVAVLQFAARHPVGRAPVLTLRRFLYDGVDSKQLNQHFPPRRIGPDARRPN